MQGLSTWSPRRWTTAGAAGAAIAIAVGLPTDVISNPVFGRSEGVTWWSYPTLLITAVLGGLLVATYVRDPGNEGADDPADDDLDAPGRVGGASGLLTFFAVGCPTCNKLVVVALGSSGALDWFAPAQPVLGALSLGLLAWALRARLRGADACPIAA